MLSHCKGVRTRDGRETQRKDPLAKSSPGGSAPFFTLLPGPSQSRSWGQGGCSGGSGLAGVRAGDLLCPRQACGVTVSGGGAHRLLAPGTRSFCPHPSCSASWPLEYGAGWAVDLWWGLIARFCADVPAGPLPPRPLPGLWPRTCRGRTQHPGSAFARRFACQVLPLLPLLPRPGRSTSLRLGLHI